MGALADGKTRFLPPTLELQAEDSHAALEGGLVAGQDGEEDTDKMAEELREAAAATPPPPAPWGFVISITRHGKHRKLHHVGDSRLIPGLGCKDFVVLGNRLPDSTEVNSVCARCFKRESPQAELSPESIESSSASMGGKLGIEAEGPEVEVAWPEGA